jgi:hypothetical protein
VNLISFILVSFFFLIVTDEKEFGGISYFLTGLNRFLLRHWELHQVLLLIVLLNILLLHSGVLLILKLGVVLLLLGRELLILMNMFLIVRSVYEVFSVPILVSQISGEILLESHPSTALLLDGGARRFLGDWNVTDEEVMLLHLRWLNA